MTEHCPSINALRVSRGSCLAVMGSSDACMPLTQPPASAQSSAVAQAFMRDGGQQECAIITSDALDSWITYYV